MTIPAGVNNHIELVFRPGARDKVIKLLTLLGCEPISSSQPFHGVYFHFAKTERLWASEVTAEQWAFEQWLQLQLAEHGDAASEAFLQRLTMLPQAHSHFGIGTTTLDEWEGVTRRVQDAAKNDTDLAGHISVPVSQRPQDPDSVCGNGGGKMGRTLYQTFLRTDLF